MKIRRLEIQGFKSFADRMVFEFDAGISAIVGPNGCGKSNVVDALKWVLGDMSPRSLRGKKMEDVIFAGSRHRKPLGLAEVTLVLDNEDGLLPTELTEVSLTRRLHRSGESEYLINRETARLKDIRELFLDTGVGTEGNAIMEQGQIDALLAANPQDRRGIFEEAAGVSRYKQRRKEADQRLQRTQENLARLRDVLDLEEKRLRSLKSQAAKARRYQELREELAARRVQRAVVRYHEVAGERDALATQLNALGEREASAAEELAGLEQATDSHEAELVAARERVRELEAAIASAASDVRAARDRVAYAQRDAEQLVERRGLLAQQAEADGARRATLAGEIEALETHANEAHGRMEADAERVRAAEADLVELDREAATIRDAHDGAKREALDALGRLGELRNDEAAHRTEARQAEERRRRLEEQRAEVLVRAERVEAEARELVALTASLDEAAREQAAALEAAEEARAGALGRADAANRRRAGAAERRASASARLDVLARMAAAREGTDAGARRILAALERIEPDADGARDGLFGLVADCVAPAADLAAELDLRLGQAAGALLARSTADALRWLAWLREKGEGEAARFLCLDFRPHAPAADDLPEAARLGCDGELADLVRGVLARTALVADLPSALDAVTTQGRHAVTLSGDRVTDSGAVLGGRTATALGLVERGAEIRSLRQQIAELEAEHHEASNEAQAAVLAVREADEQIRRLRRELQQRTEDRQRRGEALARVERERALQAETVEVLAAEVAELVRAAATAEGLRAQKATEAEALEAERATLEDRAEEAARGYAAVEARRREAGERRMNLLLALAETKAKSEAAARRVLRAREEIAALDERLAGHAREREVLERRLAEAEVEATEAESLAKHRESARGVAGEELVKARATLTDLERVAHAAVARRREVQALHERLRDELSGFRAREAELRARVEVLLDQVRQDHGLDLAEVARETQPGEALDVAAMTEEVESLQRRLESLGNVNLNALDELTEVEAHVNGLKEQEHDLITASGDLGQAIQELDRITTERFGATFDQIRENFRNTFRRLFGGGRADVMLEDASNLLESGIEIVARPPGKEQRTISLLSGGERTLTATALLFAVFQAKPSPFALLDEVDAALDEANVRRLLGLVREFADRCQFIIITHAKSTMEAADLLYGVTMEEPGVSKKVAVRLTEYAQAPTPTPAAAAGSPHGTGRSARTRRLHVGTGARGSSVHVRPRARDGAAACPVVARSRTRRLGGRGGAPRTHTTTRSHRVADVVGPEREISDETVAERQGRSLARSNDPLPRPPGWPGEAFRWVLRQDVRTNVIVAAAFLLVGDIVTLFGAAGFGWILQSLFVAVFVLRGWITLVGQVAAGSDSARGYEKSQDIGRGAPSFSAAHAILAFAPAGLLLPVLVALWILPAEAGWIVALLTLAWSTTALLGWALHDRKMLWPHVAMTWWVHRPAELAWATTGWIGMILAGAVVARLAPAAMSQVFGAFIATVVLRVASVAWLFVAARVLGVVGRSWTPGGYRPPPA